MKLISAGQYVGYRCKKGGGSGGSTTASTEDAQSMGAANCGAGNYWVITVG